MGSWTQFVVMEKINVGSMGFQIPTNRDNTDNWVLFWVTVCCFFHKSRPWKRFKSPLLMWGDLLVDGLWMDL